MLEEIKKRLAAISSGKWDTYMSEIVVNKHTPEVQLIACTNDNSPNQSNDAQFIAHAPDDIAWLIAEVEKLRQKNDELWRMVGDRTGNA